MKITFLVDECLSPDIAAYAEGVYHFQATHVLYRKLAGKEDRDLMPYQVEWFDVVLNRITREKDIINKVITIDRDKKIKIFDWSKDNAGTPPPPGL